MWNVNEAEDGSSEVWCFHILKISFSAMGLNIWNHWFLSKEWERCFLTFRSPHLTIASRAFSFWLMCSLSFFFVLFYFFYLSSSSSSIKAIVRIFRWCSLSMFSFWSWSLLDSRRTSSSENSSAPFCSGWALSTFSKSSGTFARFYF